MSFKLLTGCTDRPRGWCRLCSYSVWNWRC